MFTFRHVEPPIESLRRARHLLEVSGHGGDVLFAQRMRGILHLLALSNALTKHLNLNADVMTVLTSEVRHDRRFSLAVWAVAALARLETQNQITKLGELLPASEDLRSHGAGRQRGRMKARIIFRDTIDFGIFQSLGDRLHDRVLAYSASVRLQLFFEIRRKLSGQLGESAAPVRLSVKSVASSASNRSVRRALRDNLCPKFR